MVPTFDYCAKPGDCRYATSGGGGDEKGQLQELPLHALLNLILNGSAVNPCSERFGERWDRCNPGSPELCSKLVYGVIEEGGAPC